MAKDNSKEQSYLRDAVLATLAYYDILNLPLTLIEIYKNLINPSRVFNNLKSVDEIKLSDVLVVLDKLCEQGKVNMKNGFYALGDVNDLYESRINTEKIASDKWRKLISCAKWLLLSPNIRGVFASGSMAVGNVNDKSDWDILVIVKSGRIYTTRIFLLLISALMGRRRKRIDRIASDKFCFNHYITNKSLLIGHQSLFNAQTYSNLKPIYMSRDVFRDFYVNNNWINKYVYNFKPSYEYAERTIKFQNNFKKVGNVVERILNNRFGDWLEGVLKKYQTKRIKRNLTDQQGRGRITFNDEELEFHPQSFEGTVISQYNYKIRQLGLLPPFEEADSGLT